MSYCLNPDCPKPQNTNNGNFCLTCGTKLLLKQRYRAIKPIGQGGFGRTFLAVDEDKPSQPTCVIKQFHLRTHSNSVMHKAEQLFTQEAMRLDELGKHPQIPELLAYFTPENQQYLVQEFIDGQNLEQELADKGVFSENQIRQLLNDLLPVLQFCHAKNVIHRDIKPENIIRRRSDRKLVLVDFGAAKEATKTALNTTGTSIGSPEYMAPEQIRGKAVFASDIYSLGVTCVYLLTQHSPFDLYDVYHAAWIWQQFLKTPVSERLSCILNKMLEGTINRRYLTADEVLLDLKGSQISQPTTTVAPSQIDRELEEMKTMFLSGVNSKGNNSNQFQQKVAQPLSKSKIDEELEEIKAKYKKNGI